MKFGARSGWIARMAVAAAVICGAAGAAVGQTDITAKFRDPIFRAAVYKMIGKTAPVPILDSDVSGITSVHVGGASMGISDLSGIEYFTVLTSLECSLNQLTALDVSKNTALTNLDCGRNQLTTLDVSKNTALTSLGCYRNQLTTLDVSKNTALRWLNCSNNQLTMLNVSGATALTELYCVFNHFTTLDVSKSTALTKLDCSDNLLTTLDLSKNIALTKLNCSNYRANPSPEYKLTTLDVSKNIALTELNCSYNRLTKLDVSKNIALKSLNCGRNDLTALDVSNNTVLDTLGCYDNQLTTLDVTKNTALKRLYCDNIGLTTLDVSKNTALTDLSCMSNLLTTLDVSKNTALKWLDCNRNRLTTLDVSKNTALWSLNCWDNKLTTLDVSKNTALTDLNCSDNQLITLDVSNVPLTYLDCSKNHLSRKDIIGLNESNLKNFSFNPQTYLLMFNSQGGSDIDPRPSSYPLPYPTKSGYVFCGWYRDTTYTDSQWRSDTLTANITLYAKWIPVLTITFNANGGTVTTEFGTNRADSTLASSLPTPTRDNYIFNGWFTAETDGEKVTTSRKYSTNTTIYAQWIPIFIVTFNATGGTVTTTSGTTRADSTLVSSLPTPTRGDYAFNGWFTAETDGEKVTASKKYSANTTIYAQWTQSVYTVTLDPAGGTVTPTTVKIGESGRIVSLPTPANVGYTFDGWFTAANSGEKVTDGYTLSGDATIYAQWTYYIVVTEITGIPSAIKVGEQFPLTGTVVPENAARNTIVWSIENAGTTNAGIYNGVFIAMSEGQVVLKATIVDGTAVGTPYEQFFFINAVAVSVASPARLIPSARPAEITSISPVTPLTAVFTAGPNPVSKSSGKVSFFRNGSRVSYATLSIYDASGNVIRKIRVIDDAVGSQTRRKVSSWDLRDAKGRLVSEGTYVVRGTVKANGGKREKVSVVVGVR